MTLHTLNTLIRTAACIADGGAYAWRQWLLTWRLDGCVQVSNWMTVPGPLNVLFFPVTICETYLQWVVTWVD